jgi:hypothetical protein
VLWPEDYGTCTELVAVVKKTCPACFDNEPQSLERVACNFIDRAIAFLRHSLFEDTNFLFPSLSSYFSREVSNSAVHLPDVFDA